MHIDQNGHDAIYVVNFGREGLPIVGHALLFYQDISGVWYKTEFAGGKKSDAILHNDPAFTYECSNPKYEEVLATLKSDSYKATILTGDFSVVAEFFILNQKNYDYKYNLFTKNCLTYIKNALEYTGNVYITGFQFIPANYTPILKDERSVISRSVDIPVKIDSFMCFVDM